MDKLQMHTPDIAEENYKKLAALFPDAVTETVDEDGNVVRAIDKDVLTQEINTQVVDDGQERYQFTWPDKRKSVVLANAPIAKTLRFEQEKSVGRDGTPGGTDSENIYIEGDNLDALKLLQETYLGKVKMIYIDPPYNTGNDFIYEDDFSQESEGYVKEESGQYDEEGNMLVQNTESNGRFHTDWLNMIYPRVKIAKDLLSDDGVIFISIDDNEQENLKKVCDEIFGADNFVAEFIWKSRQNKDNRNVSGVSIDHEYIICYSRESGIRALHGDERKTNQYSNPDNDPRGPWTSANMAGLLPADQRPNCHYDLVNPLTGINYGRPAMGWRYDKSTMKKLIDDNRIIWPDNPNGRPRKKSFLSEVSSTSLPGYSSLVGNNIYTRTATSELTELLDDRYFNFPKPSELIKEFINQSTEDDSIILDFFSGSATTAHATMQLNAEDGGHRKSILVQLPELTYTGKQEEYKDDDGETKKRYIIDDNTGLPVVEKDSEAHKVGYNTICDIGEERIRRAGKKIKEETNADIDYGFRCFKVDSSNMKDVYYRPTDIGQMNLDQFTDNIKEDRTPEDLLIQVMLDLGVLLSSKIEKTEIGGKKVFSVADGYLIACFDNDVKEDVVTEIAKKHPFYAVFRDSSMASDSVAANFEQIFETYSPQTVRKVL